MPKIHKATPILYSTTLVEKHWLCGGHRVVMLISRDNKFDPLSHYK